MAAFWRNKRIKIMGCHCPRHLCRITHWRHCNGGRCCGEPGSGRQNSHVWWTGQHAHL